MLHRSHHKDHTEIVRKATEGAARLISFLYCDNGGIIRGKSTHLSALAERLETGLGLTVAMQAMSDMDQLQDMEGKGPVGEIRLVPDPDTFTLLPYAPGRATMLADMVRLYRSPWEACPRHFLKRMVEKAAAEELTIQAAFEPEWTLAQKVGDAFVQRPSVFR